MKKFLIAVSLLVLVFTLCACSVSSHEHSWKDADCVNPKSCESCGATEGDVKHEWKEATCTEPKECKNCGKVAGKPVGHKWKTATCLAPKTCATCNMTEGDVGAHDWKAATCATPKTCKECGMTTGSTTDHSWKAATCATPKTCEDCGKTTGSTTDHSWKAATCTTPKTCEDCGKTTGSTTDHSWKAATCTTPKTCKECGKTTGSAAGHNWEKATCQAPKTCSICKKTEGSVVGHNYADGTCKVCGKEDPNAPPTVLYQKICYDKAFYQNKASIDRVDISDNKMYISFTILEHNGGGYNNFATDAIFYDSKNNIIGITQVMYETNINTKIGSSFVDYAYIPEGTRTILINSATKNLKYKVSKDHGESDIELEVPSVCYDESGYGNTVEVKSYNVDDGKIYFTYMVKDYYGGGYTCFATEMIFYGDDGAVLKTCQALYANKVGEEYIGNIYFDYTYIPKGTAKIVVAGNKPSYAPDEDVDETPTTAPTTKPTTKPTEPEEEKGWTYADAVKLDGYIKSACDCLTEAKNNCKKGNVFYAVAKMGNENAATYVKQAIELIEKNGDVTTTEGTSILQEAKDLYKLLTGLCDVTITTDNWSQYKNEISEIAYSGAVEASTLRILTTKMLAAF